MIEKAGLLPYRYRDDEIEYLFMKSSDAQYGGPLPQVSKGVVEPGETFLEAALREAEEELGLKKRFIVTDTLSLIWEETFHVGKDKVHTKYWMCQIKDDTELVEPHYETESVHFMTAADFMSNGRRVHHSIVKKADRFLKEGK